MHDPTRREKKMTTLCPYDFEVLVSEDGKTARCTECSRRFELTPEGPKQILPRPAAGSVANTSRPLPHVDPREEDALVAALVHVATPVSEDDLIAATKTPIATKNPIVSGHQYFEGTVIAAKVKPLSYGDVIKITVKDLNGNRYWGSFVKSAWDQVGLTPDANINKVAAMISRRKVGILAEVDRSNDDPHFGFFHRPKIKVLS